MVNKEVDLAIARQNITRLGWKSKQRDGRKEGRVRGTPAAVGEQDVR